MCSATARQQAVGPEEGWRTRFTVPVPVGVELARRNRRRGLVSSTRSGTVELYAWDVTTGELRQLTDRPSGTPFGFISPDGGHAFHLADENGSGIGGYVRIPWAGGEPEALFPDIPAGAWSGAAISRDGTRFAATLARAGGSVVHVTDLGTDALSRGSSRVVQLDGGDWSVRALSVDGRFLALASETAVPAGETATLVIDLDAGSQVLSTVEGAPPGVALFSPIPGDSRLLVQTFRDGRRLAILVDIDTGRSMDLGLDAFAGDVQPLDWSADGDRILLATTDRAVQHLYIHDLGRRETAPIPRSTGTFGAWGGSVGFGPEDEVITLWQDSTHPPEIVALDIANGARRTVLAAGPAPTSRPWRSVEFGSSDGQRIQAWLVEPAGPRPFPAVVHAHGGPDGALTDGFSPESQAWIDAGFAFLTVNYRGSTTFGRAFEERILGEPGRWEVEDLVAARTWLIDEGIAVADEILVTGGSYGGYLTLLAAGLRPDLWAGAMAISPIADWLIQAEDANDAMRPWTTTLFGGDVADRRDQYVASSPITHADRVGAPVLLIHGRHDTIVPPRQAERYAKRLHDLGKPLELVWFDGGHMTFSDTGLLIEHQSLMLDFALRTINVDDDVR